MVNPPTKAEILITKGCNLSCSYCSLKQYDSTGKDEWKKQEELSDREWSELPSVLKEIGISFAPIYGAEPLTRLPALTNLISGCSGLNIPTTVITNGILLNSDAIKKLKRSGLSSITLSQDILTQDKSIRIKGEKTASLVDKLIREFEDVEIIVTLTRDNIEHLVPFIIGLPKEVWVHFDFRHSNKGQPGSKCLGIELPFRLEDTELIRSVMKEVRTLKLMGHRIHPTIECLNFLIDNPYNTIRQNWICEPGSWITINSDGRVIGCDDFMPTDFNFSIFDYNITWDWKTWVDEWTTQIKKCPGCIWLTHLSSSLWWRQKESEWLEEITHGRNT